jgi:poly-gamma-glutamate capsule biosynthesis protein CapA/YwtB (metallophosphatase superfamily)
MPVDGEGRCDMNAGLPVTPAEVLDISTRSLRLKMNIAVKSAELFRYWNYPRADAATDFAEMTLTDIFYWVYKCKNPITNVERGESTASLLMTDNSIVGLPPAFDKLSALTVGAAGDLLQADGLELSKDVLFESVSDLLFDQTISYANFESPVTEQELKKEVIGDREAPTECCSRAQFNVLTRHKDKRFNVLNTSNNHTFDMGIEGIETTLRTFAEDGILDVGTNHRPEDLGRAKILIKEGVKLGFVAATFGLNGRMMPEAEAYRVNTAKLLSKFVDPDLALLKQQVDDCKREGCDFIIASMHWGFEFEFFPRKRQVEATRALVEYGADAVLCHHPHVIQPVEYYRTRRDPNRIAVIAYSLGSLAWGYTAPHIVLSMILNLTLAKGQRQGNTVNGTTVTYIEAAKVTPIFRSAVNQGGKTLTRIEKLADHIDGRSRSHPREYVAKISDYAELVLGGAT